MKLTIFVFINIIVAITAASIGKLNGVGGSVSSLEFDLKSDAYIVTKVDYYNRLYKLDYQNQVVFTRLFIDVVDLKFDSKNDAYIFNQVDDRTRMVWVLNSDSVEISNLFNYSASADHPAFFDTEDNLFLDTESGIGVLVANSKVVKPIPRLAGYHLKTKDSYDAYPNGNVFLGVKSNDSTKDESVMLGKSEKTKDDPIPLFYNIKRFGDIQAQRMLNSSLYLIQDKAVIRFNNHNVFVISKRDEPTYGDIYIADTRIFVKYLENGICNVKEITSSDTIVDVEVSLQDSCNIHQTIDKYGTVYFGSSDYGSIVQYNKINDVTKQIKMPDSLYIFGLTTSENGSLWILTQVLYVVPFGQTEAVAVGGLPYLAEPWPFKAKPGTNDVFIGSDSGIYIATI